MVLRSAEGLDEFGWNTISYSFSVTDGSIPTAVVGDILVDLNGTVTNITDQTLTDFGDSLNRSHRNGSLPRL